MNIQPFHDYYLVKLLEAEERTTGGGVILPESVQKKLSTVMGVIERVPFPHNQEADLRNLMQGVTVIIKPDVNIMYEAVDMGDEGKFFLTKYENIIAVLNEETE